MGHPKEDEVLRLKEQNLSERDIARSTGVPPTTVHRIIKAAAAESPTIKGTGQQWAVKINPWVRLIHEAAVEQIAECREISLDDFIYYCCDFVKRTFRLTPPGWAQETEPELDLTQPDGWELPQVVTAARIIEREVESGGEPVGARSQPPQSEVAAEHGQRGEQ